MLQAQADLTDRDVELSGTVRIGAPDGLSTYYLAAASPLSRSAIPPSRSSSCRRPQVVPLSKREVDIAIVLEKPEAGRFVTRKLTDYSLGIFASADYLARITRPATRRRPAAHRLVGYVEDYTYSSALNYVRELYGDAPTAFECASAIGQLEAVRAGLGLGVCTLHRGAASGSRPRAARAAGHPRLLDRRARRHARHRPDPRRARLHRRHHRRRSRPLPPR